jgi:3-deoxy-7-phosphoheptulonate synthase
MDEFLLAAEYILKTGNTQVMLCERGIRTFEDHTRFTLPLATVPYLKQTTHLPVVVDPSHGTGKASLVAPMAVAAIACGADGLIIEVHPDPDRAATDAEQTIPTSKFAEIVRGIRSVHKCVRTCVATDCEMVQGVVEHQK